MSISGMRAPDCITHYSHRLGLASKFSQPHRRRIILGILEKIATMSMEYGHRVIMTGAARRTILLHARSDLMGILPKLKFHQLGSEWRFVPTKDFRTIQEYEEYKRVTSELVAMKKDFLDKKLPGLLYAAAAAMLIAIVKALKDLAKELSEDSEEYAARQKAIKAMEDEIEKANETATQKQAARKKLKETEATWWEWFTGEKDRKEKELEQEIDQLIQMVDMAHKIAKENEDALDALENRWLRPPSVVEWHF